MAHRISRRLVRPTFCLAAAAVVGGGCAPSKTVTLNSTPDRASLLVYKVTADGKESPLPLAADEGRTPTTLKLDMADDVHYRVEAHRVLCAPNPDTQVRLEPMAQTSYEIALTQFKDFVTALGYQPQKSGDLWQMGAAQSQTVATIDEAEPGPPVFIDQPVAVTDNKDPNVDYPSFAVSAGANGTVMVYEEVRVNSAIQPGGQDSRLWRLPLVPGTSPDQVKPTLLTTNRKQQHNPTFSYTGDDVIFDTNDDSRSRAPVRFKDGSDESTVEHLAHDADTCETEFTAGRDWLAFTAYSPNAPGPQVMVCSRDGSGSTVRDRGMSPQMSPDGNWIAFVHRPENDPTNGHLRLAIVNVRGPVRTSELQLDPDHDVAQPHWSPDGRLIAYCSNLREGPPVDLQREPDARFREGDETHSFLWLVSADGRNPVQLTHGENFDSDPVFDPNGKTVYFRSNRGGRWNIWKCNLTDTAMTKVVGGR
jgi:hypothetical protein